MATLSGNKSEKILYIVKISTLACLAQDSVVRQLDNKNKVIWPWLTPVSQQYFQHCSI